MSYGKERQTDILTDIHTFHSSVRRIMLSLHHLCRHSCHRIAHRCNDVLNYAIIAIVYTRAEWKDVLFIPFQAIPLNFIMHLTRANLYL